MKNHYTSLSQWTVPIATAKIETTGFTHQTAIGGTEDYAKWSKKMEGMYATPVENKLVIDGELVIPKSTRVRKGRR